MLVNRGWVFIETDVNTKECWAVAKKNGANGKHSWYTVKWKKIQIIYMCIYKCACIYIHTHTQSWPQCLNWVLEALCYIRCWAFGCSFRSCGEQEFQKRVMDDQGAQGDLGKLDCSVDMGVFQYFLNPMALLLFVLWTLSIPSGIQAWFKIPLEQWWWEEVHENEFTVTKGEREEG